MGTMPTIQTFVVLDLETTDKPELGRRTKITEIAMMATTRESFLTAVWQDSRLPRVAHKILFCVNPNQIVSTGATNMTGLHNVNLKQEKRFDKDLCESIRLFLQRLPQPVCLVAHYGSNCDFPILRSELHDIGETLPEDLLWVDSWHAFKEFFPIGSHRPRTVTADNNSGSPHKTSATLRNHRLSELFKFLFSEDEQMMNAHSAEGDVEALMKCMVVEGAAFVEWADGKAKRFCDVNKKW